MHMLYMENSRIYLSPELYHALVPGTIWLCIPSSRIFFEEYTDLFLVAFSSRRAPHEGNGSGKIYSQFSLASGPL